MNNQEDRPLISVVIPARNERNNIASCLESIKRQSYPKVEIIVVDNASIDGTAEIAAQYTDRIVSEGRTGITFAKNTGIKIAEGEFVATTDADCIVEEKWLEELIKHFDDPLVASVGGVNLAATDASDFEKCVDSLLSALSKIIWSRYVSSEQYVTHVFHNPGCNVMYRKHILEELGGFNEELLTVEDEELDLRIKARGYKILFTPFAKVYHKRRSNWKSLILQVYRYAIGRMQFVRLHPSINQWPRFVPSLFILSVLVLLFASIFNMIFFKILLVGLVIVLSGWLARSLRLSFKSKRNYFVVYFVLFFLVFWVWGIGFIRGAWYRQS